MGTIMIKVGIIGATGYAGGELVRILMNHQDAKIVWYGSRSYIDKKYYEVYQNMFQIVEDVCKDDNLAELAEQVDVIFTATPQGFLAGLLTEEILSKVKIVDLSADYRIKDVAVYEKWYGHEHTDVENLQNAVYGLPEFFRDEIKGADLVANPGCYATSIILACGPLLKAGVVDEDILVDAKSGTSGAGMVPSARTHHSTCGETIIPYSVGKHRHTPEIEMAVDRFAGSHSKVTFVPQLLPIVRGILSSCYFNLKKDLSQEEVDSIYEKQYGNETFVHYVQEPSIRAVVASNHAQVASKVIGDKTVSFGVLDNLVKGASGQAVQCMNLMLGLDEKTGLNIPGLGV